MANQVRISYGSLEIHSRMRIAAYKSERFDICSYWAGTGTESIALLRIKPNSRVIVGGLGEYFKAVSMAHAIDRFGGRCRYLEGCHIKLFIFYQPKPIAFLGSMNLGKGMPFEMATELIGSPAKECVMHFNNLWNLSEPVKAGELKDIADRLAVSSFEQKRTVQTSPVPTRTLTKARSFK